MYSYKVPYARGLVIPIYYTLTFFDNGTSLTVAFNHEGHKDTWKALPVRRGGLRGYRLEAYREKLVEPRRVYTSEDIYTNWEDALSEPMRKCRIRKLRKKDAIEWKICLLPSTKEEWKEKRRDGKRKADSGSDWWYSDGSLGTYLSRGDYHKRVERYNRA